MKSQYPQQWYCQTVMKKVMKTCQMVIKNSVSTLIQNKPNGDENVPNGDENSVCEPIQNLSVSYKNSDDINKKSA